MTIRRHDCPFSKRHFTSHFDDAGTITLNDGLFFLSTSLPFSAFSVSSGAPFIAYGVKHGIHD